MIKNILNFNTISEKYKKNIFILKIFAVSLDMQNKLCINKPRDITGSVNVIVFAIFICRASYFLARRVLIGFYYDSKNRSFPLNC